MKRKIATFGFLIIGILSIAIVPISMFICRLPNCTSLSFCLLLTFCAFLLIRSNSKGLFSKIVIGVLCAFFYIATLLGNYCNPYWNSTYRNHFISDYTRPIDTKLSKQDALYDLDYAMYYLQKDHPKYYKNKPKDVEEQYQKVYRMLHSKKKITVNELSQQIESIFSVLGDGHSYVKSYMQIPHYLNTTPAFLASENTLLKINNTTYDELIKKSKSLYSFEVVSWQKMLINEDLLTLEGLSYLGFDTSKEITFTYQTKDENVRTETFKPADFKAFDREKISPVVTDDTNSFVSYQIDKEKSLATLTLDSCIYDDEYQKCLEEMFTKVKQEQIKNVAVDLRNNCGGDSRVADEFIRYLNVDKWNVGGYKWRLGTFRINTHRSSIVNEKYDTLLFNGNVYVLTSTNSFSSAMLFAQYIKDNNLGTLIGEAPGNTPNGYGEIATFQLPKSKIYMQVSTKEFFRADKTSKSNLVDPDIPCESSKAKQVLNKIVDNE